MSDHGSKRKGDDLAATAGKKARPADSSTSQMTSKRGIKRKFCQATGGTIPMNSKGILVSCLAGKEKYAGSEAIRLLSLYYEQLVPRKQEDGQNATGKSISHQLGEELKSLKDPEQQVFRAVKTGVKGLIYLVMLESAGVTPGELLWHAATDIDKTKECKSRLCMRFIPVDAVTHPTLEDIQKVAQRCVSPHFPSEDDAKPVSFAVVYEHRASAKMDRMAVINAAIESIKQPPHKVDLKDAEVSVLVHIVKNFCTIGVATRYQHLSKYNFRELSGATEKDLQAKKLKTDESHKQQADDNSPEQEGKSEDEDERTDDKDAEN